MPQVSYSPRTELTGGSSLTSGWNDKSMVVRGSNGGNSEYHQQIGGRGWIDSPGTLNDSE